MERYAKQREINAYKNEIADYVAQVDQFVFTLQRFAEKKWIIAVLIMSLSMLSIIAMVAYVVWYARKEVVMPLNNSRKPVFKCKCANLAMSKSIHKRR